LLLACTSQAADIRVNSPAALAAAAGRAQPGDRIVVEPGRYPGGLDLRNLHGQPGKPIVIAGADPERRPVIEGGQSGLQLSEVSHLELRDLEVSGAAVNGINLDDGGSFETPSHHITLAGLSIHDVNPRGNHDGLKMSGIDDFRVERCEFQGWGGSAIDMVGCHRGVIEDCVFRNDDTTGTGPQTKGGSSEVTIRRCRFEHAGQRAVNIGGSTGMAYFRPRPQGYEAKAITVEGNVFIGSLAPLAFVGVDGATVRFNTFYVPTRWAMRILQETAAPGFVPSRGGVVTDNIFVFRANQWSEGGVNIGGNTAPETFRFARNHWYCLDRPTASRPRLPSEEQNGVYGADPQFTAPDQGDLSLRTGSPAQGKGHTALPAQDPADA
jgi:hypothetical protein